MLLWCLIRRLEERVYNEEQASVSEIEQTGDHRAITFGPWPILMFLEGANAPHTISGFYGEGCAAQKSHDGYA